MRGSRFATPCGSGRLAKRWSRRLALVVAAGASVLAVAAPASASTIKIPATVHEVSGSVGGGRCGWYIVAFWRSVPHAVSYDLVYYDSTYKSRESVLASPPYTHDTIKDIGEHAPAGGHQMDLTGLWGPCSSPPASDWGLPRFSKLHVIVTLPGKSKYLIGGEVRGPDVLNTSNATVRSEGRPKGGVLVRLIGPQPNEVRTKPSGSYTFKLKKKGRYTVILPHRYCYTTHASSDPPRCQSSRSVTVGPSRVLDFKQGSHHSVSGSVLDYNAPVPKPAAGVPVVASWSDPKTGQNESATVRADGRGHFAFQALADANIYTFFVPRPNGCAMPNTIRIPQTVTPPGSAALPPCQSGVDIWLTHDSTADFYLAPRRLKVTFLSLNQPSGKSKRAGTALGLYYSGLSADAVSGPHFGDPVFGDLYPNPSGTGSLLSCVSGCVSFNDLTVTDNQTGEPVGGATIEIYAPVVKGSRVVNPTGGGGYFCTPIKNGQSNCNNPLTLKTDAQGRVGQIVYWFPGIVAPKTAKDPRDARPLPVTFTVKATKPDPTNPSEGYRPSLTQKQIGLMPNLGTTGTPPHTVGTYTITLTKADATFLDIWAEVANGPRYVNLVRKLGSPVCDRAKHVVSLLFKNDANFLFKFGSKAFEVKKTIEGLCGLTDSKIIDAMNELPRLFELQWALKRFHIRPEGLVAYWSPSVISASHPSDLVPSLHSDFATAVVKAVTQLARNARGFIKPGTKLRLDIFEVSAVPSLRASHADRSWSPGSFRSISLLFKIIGSYVTAATDHFTPGLYLRFSAGSGTRLKPMGQLDTDGYSPQLWLRRIPR